MLMAALCRARSVTISRVPYRDGHADPKEPRYVQQVLVEPVTAGPVWHSAPVTAGPRRTLPGLTVLLCLACLPRPTFDVIIDELCSMLKELTGHSAQGSETTTSSSDHLSGSSGAGDTPPGCSPQLRGSTARRSQEDDPIEEV